MIRLKDNQRSVERSPGVTMRVPVEPDEMYGAGRLYAHITVQPGAALDFHVHEGEMESFYILKGTACVRDNNNAVTLTAGDAIITPDNECHGLYNDSDKPVELMALIISRVQGKNGSSRPVSTLTNS